MIQELKRTNRIIYILSRPKTKAPSTFVRGEIFKNHYNKSNIEALFFKLYINESFSKRLSPVLSKILNRIFFNIQFTKLLFILRNYDIVLIIKFLPKNYYKVLRFFYNGILGFDFDDSIWLENFYGENYFKLISSNSDFLIVDNFYLKQRASIYNNKVFVLNGPVKIPEFKVNKFINKTYNVGWIGSESTFFYLLNIKESLLKLDPNKFELTILGVKDISSKYSKMFQPLKVTFKDYNNYNMSEQLKDIDIGLYPLDLSELSEGRGSLKAMVYSSNSIPCIASKSESNINLFIENINILFASSDNWSELISGTSQYEFNKIRINAYELSINNFSINSVFNKKLHILKNILNHSK